MRVNLQYRTDSGVTLVELLVVMVIIGIVGAMITQAVILASSNTRFNEDEARGLEDVRKVVERLGRDIRQSRSIAIGADESQLVLWIDYSSDYKQQANETVTWRLQESDTEEGHFDVLRTVDGAATYRQATTLVSDIAFCYSVSATSDGNGDCLPMDPVSGGVSAANAPRIRLVAVSMTYDAFLNTGTGVRTVDFSSRLRNVG